MTNKKKRFYAVALVIWILGLICLGSKAFDEFRSGKIPFSNADDTITLKNIMFPSLKSQELE
jgi:hypothetical protein